MNVVVKKILIKRTFLMSLVVFLFVFSITTEECFAAVDNYINFRAQVENSEGNPITDGSYDVSFGLYTEATGGSAVWSENWTASTSFSALISNVSANSNTITYTYTGGVSTSTLQVGQTLNNSTVDDYSVIVDYNIASNTITVVNRGTTWSVGNSINNRPRVEDGVLNLNLGKINSLAEVNFNQTLYLEVIFNSEIMRPRKLITPSAQSLNSVKLNNREENEFAAISDNETITGEWNINNILNIASSSTSTALTVNQTGAGKRAEFKSGNSSYFSIQPDGRIGISSSTPDSLLTIYSNGSLSLPFLHIATSTNEILYINSNGNIGIGTTTPWKKLSIEGDMALSGKLYDSFINAGTNGMVLETTGNGIKWVATSTLGFGGGTVSSVDMTTPTGLTISGNPITTAGTLALGLEAGYNIPLTASTTNWNTFYNTPSTRITAGTNISWSSNTLNVADSWWSSLDEMPLAQGYFYVGNASNNPEATSSMFMADNGYLGLGTTSPDVLLHVGDNVASHVSGAEDAFISGSLELDNLLYVNGTGTSTIAGNLSVGKTETGAWPYNNTYAYFGHKDLNHNAVGNYALLQSNLGATYLNAASGQNLYLRINNSDQITISDNNITFNASSLSIPNNLNIGSSTLYINNSTNFVGMGTNNPGGILELYGASDFYPQLKISYDSSNFGMIKVDSGGELELQGSNGGNVMVDSGVKLGIGTSTPNSLLTVYSDGTLTSPLMNVATGTVNIFHISNIGNVGIGTIYPTNLLHIHDVDGNNSTIKLTNSSTGFGVGDGMDLGINNSYGFVWVEEDMPLKLGVNNNEVMILSNNERIGIGTSTPASKLQINSINAPQFRLSYNSNNYTDFNVQSSGGLQLSVNNNSAILAIEGDRIGIGTTTSLTDTLTIQNTVGNSLAVLDNQGRQKVTILSNGGLGLGTLNPSTMFDVISTSSVLMRLGYDSSNYTEFFSNQHGGLFIRNNSNSPALSVFDNKVAVGTTSPSVLFHVGSSSPSIVSGYQDSYFSGSLELDNLLYVDGIGTSTIASDLKINGNLGVGTTTSNYKFVLSGGTAYCDQAACWNDASTRDLKKNIQVFTNQDYANILKEVKDTDINYYNMIYENDPRTYIGVIAEDAPNWITTNNKKAISASAYANFLMAGLKGLIKEVDDLKLSVNLNKNQLINSNNEPNLSPEDIFILDDDGYLVINKVKSKDVKSRKFTLDTGTEEKKSFVGRKEIGPGRKEIFVENENITKDSEIFVTFKNNIDGASWWICGQEEKKLFKLCLSKELLATSTFSYWILDVENNVASTSVEGAGVQDSIDNDNTSFNNGYDSASSSASNSLQNFEFNSATSSGNILNIGSSTASTSTQNNL